MSGGPESSAAGPLFFPQSRYSSVMTLHLWSQKTPASRGVVKVVLLALSLERARQFIKAFG